MEQVKKIRRKAHVDTALCVACGCCAKVCALNALTIYHGLYASVNVEKCVGCGKCVRECPAGIIVLQEVQA